MRVTQYCRGYGNIWKSQENAVSMNGMWVILVISVVVFFNFELWNVGYIGDSNSNVDVHSLEWLLAVCCDIILMSSHS